jgi:hypothetical protein
MPMSEYDELREKYEDEHHERLMLNQKLDSLMNEIAYLRDGAPKLLNEIIQLDNEKKWDVLIRIYSTLRRDFPNTNELRQAKPYYDNAIEERTWEATKKKDSKESYEKYVEDNSDGKYLNEAKLRIIEIKKEKFLEALKEAKQKNTSRTWKSFLEEYPDYVGKEQVEQKIISLEVDEIFSNQNTGKLPATNRTGNNSSTESSVAITNNTGYTLVLRYSGPSVKKVSIPSYGTRTVNLSSGRYKVAASAGGLNYAGAEYLSGSYESKYYISSY